MTNPPRPQWQPQWQTPAAPAPAPKKRKAWPWVLLGGALVLLLIGAIGSANGKGTTAAPATTAAAATTATKVAATKAAPATSAAVDVEAQLKKFEADNAIPSSTWYSSVTSREVKFGNSLWVYTKFPADAEAKSLAGGICGAYAQYVLVDPKVRTTFVRAADGQQLAKCGPGA